MYALADNLDIGIDVKGKEMTGLGKFNIADQKGCTTDQTKYSVKSINIIPLTFKWLKKINRLFIKMLFNLFTVVL